jgi:hypothetical protein
MTEPGKSWDTTPMKGWKAAVDKWDWEPWETNGTQIGYVKSGNCLRCGHLIAIYQHFYRGITVVPVSAVCNCEYPHTDRPPDKGQGCGQHAAIEPKQ